MSHSNASVPAKTRPRRNGLPSARITDGNNAQPPTPDQRRALESMKVLALIKKIQALAPLLPDSVAEASEDDNELHRVLTETSGIEDSPWGTLNRQLDKLFGTDSRENGRLKYIRRVSSELVEIKLQRIMDELQYLCNTNAEVETALKPKQPPKKRLEPVVEKAADNNSTAAAKSGTKGAPTADSDDDDPDYALPKRGHPHLSEEEEDDFMDVDQLATPANPRKRKVLVTECNGATKHGAVPTQAKTAAHPPPEVIEIDDEDAPTRKRGKCGPKSDTRLHFHEPAAIIGDNGEKRWEFRCKHCKSSHTFARTLSRDASLDDEPNQPRLGNLATHLKKHGDVPIPDDTQPGLTRGISASSAKIMEEFLREGKLNPAVRRTQGGFLKVFAAWLLEDDLPFTTGETDGIRRLFEYMQVNYILPSDTTVKNTLVRIFTDMYNNLKADLKMVKSKIAASTDTWTTRSMQYTFAGTILSWIDEQWELVERVVDFRPIEDKEHEGQYAAYGLAKCLSDLEALEKISLSSCHCIPLCLPSLHTLSLTLDNVSANDVLVRTLSRLLMEKFDIQFAPDNSQIRCIAHVVNLVVQKLLAAFNEAADPDNDDYYIPNKDEPFHYNVDDDPVQLALENEPIPVDDDAVDEARVDDADAALLGELAEEFADLTPLNKLRLITTKICSSPQRRHAFRLIAEDKYGNTMHAPNRRLASLLPVRDVKHRWNYTEAMIARARLLRVALDRWVLDHAELQALFLLEKEWGTLEKLGDILSLASDNIEQGVVAALDLSGRSARECSMRIFGLSHILCSALMGFQGPRISDFVTL
ncbi:Eukaryotic translation initiation factor 3 [Mycena venus]|uniref:Eukaryotic translation initiation factor 3 n=1 Tax=Mycena venus TaxID=2733690 RepID=A0A8H6Z9A3_9AGAR|nr:Eukaryotic translation initiation factor 3 [Mycena venus]